MGSPRGPDAEPLIGQSASIAEAATLHEVAALNQQLLIMRAEYENLALDLADEKAERYRLAKAADQLRQEIIAYSRELKAAHLESEENHRLRQRIEDLHQQLLRADAAYRSILSSASWRAGKPIRLLGRLSGGLRRRVMRWVGPA